MLQKMLLSICFLFTTPSFAAKTVASVGPKKISLKEFKRRYEEVKAKTINPPAPEVFLEDLIRYHVGLQEAEKRKLRRDPQFKEKIEQELYKLLVERAIGKDVEKIRVTEAEMRKYYKTSPELRTSHILIEFAPNATKQQREVARKRAQEIYDEVKKSKQPFAELVKLYTDDTLSRNTGGDIGYQSRVTLVPTYYEAARKMKVGQVRGLIRSRYGYHIVKLTGKRDFTQANKRQIRAAVFDEKRKRIFDRYFGKLKKKYKIKSNAKLVKNMK